MSLARAPFRKGKCAYVIESQAVCGHCSEIKQGGTVFASDTEDNNNRPHGKGSLFESLSRSANMLTSDIATGPDHDQLVAAACKKAGVATDMVLGFRDVTEFLEEYLKECCGRVSRLICAGHVSPDVAIAADRADMKVEEALGESPFSGDVRSALALVEKKNDVIYVANPNRITGANFSIRDLRSLAAAVPDGALIIDEHFFEYFEITGLPMLRDHGNVVILRSLACPARLGTSDAGFAVAHKTSMARIRERVRVNDIPRATCRALVRGLVDAEAANASVKEAHDESLRLAISLTRLGIQCRLSATNFVLLRVASPKDVGNSLVAGGVSVENLDGYPLLKNYMRYRIGSPRVNDRLVKAFTQMLSRHFKMSGYDCRAAIQRRRKQVTEELPRLRQGCETEMYSHAVERQAIYQVADN